MGSRFAVCLEGHHRCFFLESISSLQSPERAFKLCDPFLTPRLGKRSGVEPYVECAEQDACAVSAAVNLFAEGRCLFSCMDVSKWGWTGTTSDVRNLQWETEQEAAQHILWIFMSRLKQDFHKFHPMFLWLAFLWSATVYTTISKPLSLIHFPAISFCFCFHKTQCA